MDGLNFGLAMPPISSPKRRLKVQLVRRCGGSFFFVFGIGLLIYMSVLLYGQFVLGAVIEEKETRIAEILFSSMRSFPLMMGKLIGVSLVALTQLGIWATAFLAFSIWGVNLLASRGMPITLPHLRP